jgi:hypothetical protein
MCEHQVISCFFWPAFSLQFLPGEQFTPGINDFRYIASYMTDMFVLLHREEMEQQFLCHLTGAQIYRYCLGSLEERKLIFCTCSSLVLFI